MKVIILGGTGQLKVVKPILERKKHTIVGILDDKISFSPYDHIPLFKINDAKNLIKEHESLGFCVAIGNPHGQFRVKCHDELVDMGYTPLNVFHETAWIGDWVKLTPSINGIQVMAGAKIMEEVQIDKQVIINTNASVDHECILESGVEIGPGATLCGEVKVKKGAWVAAGATIVPRIIIGQNSIVGAGAVVVKDVPNNVVVTGCPATIMRELN